ncbi:hypothetical protein BKI52_32010 [marine bacterium AO1-C]|nr:hypothetical protein BKI52_32010 [marine bacterium AO1-C]
MKKSLNKTTRIKFLKLLRWGAYVFCLTTFLFACNKQNDPVQLPPSADLKFGYIISDNGLSADYTPQSEIYQKQLADRLILKVEEENIDLEPLRDNDDVLSKPYAFEMTTTKDREVFVTTGNAAWMMGGSYGSLNGQSHLSFRVSIPIKITDNIIPDNGILEITTQDDFIKTLYTSAQSGLQVNKELTIKK